MINPRLMSISGFPKEIVRVVKDGPLILGRDPSNQLEVGDPAVSRKHCSVSEVSTDVFEIADLDSHNGTFVNGARVSRQTVQHGDRIRIGSCEFVFLTGPDEETGSLSSRSGSTATGSELKTMSLDRSGLPTGDSWIGRMARDLTAFFKIANVINSTRNMQSLHRELLELICEVIPASQAAIVLQPNASEEPSPRCMWNREGRAQPDMLIRDELVQQAIWEHCAIATAAAAKTTSAEHVLCVPLVAVERILGVIYLSSPASSPAFGEDHAYFVSAVSRIAAVTLENLSKLESLKAENQRLQTEAKGDRSLIGESRPMRRVSEFIGRVARGDSTVLIRGESGTGKELVALAIHANSERLDKPFVAVNCAAIPEALLESELFGHERGAFTGAVGTKKGKFEIAGEGTLFLDEIGELAPLLQAKLLRVLQQREFERLGGNRLLPFNARILAATNKNVEEAIKTGEFRQDLYYRLNVVSVTLPPLREHREDISLLALYFANKYAAKCHRSFKGIDAEARALLMQYSWPGNVRELENAIEHAIVLGLTDEILAEDLPNTLLEEQSAGLTAARYHNTLSQTKKQLVLAALDETNGSHIEAARLLGIHPKYLHRLIRNLNLKSAVKRQG
ncbi:MAG TPA: sigma 54-interacting transcriptional regulator [Candidatus Polarisedimenticolia bacterium]|nr:sigma 54-interacting transcriptional regulator [Candidatus Polarisedimenticolia bacterium]